jgi:hypothetical protein
MEKKIWLSIFIFHKSGLDQIQICFDFFRIFNNTYSYTISVTFLPWQK